MAIKEMLTKPTWHLLKNIPKIMLCRLLNHWFVFALKFNFQKYLTFWMVTILNDYIDGKFVSDYALYLTLNHLSDALNQAQVWQIIKPKLEVS